MFMFGTAFFLVFFSRYTVYTIAIGIVIYHIFFPLPSIVRWSWTWRLLSPLISQLVSVEETLSPYQMDLQGLARCMSKSPHGIFTPSISEMVKLSRSRHLCSSECFLGVLQKAVRYVFSGSGNLKTRGNPSWNRTCTMLRQCSGFSNHVTAQLSVDGWKWRLYYLQLG